MPLPSPFPGPVIPGPLPGSAIHEPPSLPSSSAAQRGAVESEETRHQDGPPGETLDGSMNRWYEKKGFGFVRPDGGGLDVFVHTSDIHPDDIDSIHIGAKVKFTKCWDSRKSKFKVHTINFLPSSQGRVRTRQFSRSPYRSPSRHQRASPSDRRHRRHPSGKRRRTSPASISPLPSSLAISAPEALIPAAGASLSPVAVAVAPTILPATQSITAPTPSVFPPPTFACQ